MAELMYYPFVLQLNTDYESILHYSFLLQSHLWRNIQNSRHISMAYNHNEVQNLQWSVEILL
jgi:hypothetical protein